MSGNTTKPSINNEFYEELGERWYQDDEHIIALLRAESKIKIEYVQRTLRDQGIQAGSRILDIGCGAGFVSNSLAAASYRVVGMDQSPGSLAVARRHAPSATDGAVHYQEGDAYHLAFPDQSFDAVLMMDFLEHIDQPEKAIQEAARVLKPGGVLIFYTFNRTLRSKFLAIDAVRLIARDCPDHFHVWHLFIKPSELQAMTQSSGLKTGPLQGLRPSFFHWPFWSSLFSRRVHPRFDFQFSSSLALGYMGFAQRSVG